MGRQPLRWGAVALGVLTPSPHSWGAGNLGTLGKERSYGSLGSLRMVRNLGSLHLPLLVDRMPSLVG